MTAYLGPAHGRHLVVRVILVLRWSLQYLVPRIDDPLSFAKVDRVLHVRGTFEAASLLRDGTAQHATGKTHPCQAAPPRGGRENMRAHPPDAQLQLQSSSASETGTPYPTWTPCFTS
jgi:hypothetical protein